MINNLKLIKDIARASSTKIVLLVIDGLGGLPETETGKTELETADTPNLDRLAAKGICGMAELIGPGITPGSAPGHLALFGYDPVSCNIGRGVLEAVGIDYELQPGDVAARGNFCTVDEAGLVTDRRAGRITTEKCVALCRLLDGMKIEDITISVRPVREHRFVVIFHGAGLAADVIDSDPQQTGIAPLKITALRSESGKLARIANRFIAGVEKILTESHPANMLLLRGFSEHPDLPSMKEIYKLTPAAIAVYPMYRGLAKLAGMEVLETGTTIEDEFVTLKQNYANHDFFFLHIKWADSAGEDGDFARKVKVLEQIDNTIPMLTNLEPEVIVVSGDHSTPATLKGHSWHPVPVLIHSRWCRTDKVNEFSETACLDGGLGHFSATQIMPLAMAHALKLAKFGA